MKCPKCLQPSVSQDQQFLQMMMLVTSTASIRPASCTAVIRAHELCWAQYSSDCQSTSAKFKNCCTYTGMRDGTAGGIWRLTAVYMEL